MEKRDKINRYEEFIHYDSIGDVKSCLDAPECKHCKIRMSEYSGASYITQGHYNGERSRLRMFYSRFTPVLHAFML